MIYLRVFILLIFLYNGNSTGRVTHVYPAKNGENLPSAILSAKPGDTLLIHKGIYYARDLKIDKKLHLIGVGMPVIDGRKKGNILIITAPGSSITGFEIRNSGYSGYNDIAALRVLNTRNVTVANNHFKQNLFAIYNQYSNKTRITGNRVSSDATSELLSANGIHCWKSDSLYIGNNYVTGHRDGIYFEFVTHSKVENNTSVKNVRYGLHFMFSHNDVYSGNTFQNNGAGVAVMYSHHVTMLRNKFIENWGNAAYGILLKDISDGKIEGNLFEKNTCGIFMDGSNRIQMRANQFKNNGWGMQIQANCDDNLISRNNFTGNSFDIGTNGDLVLSKFIENYWDHYTGYDLNKDGIGDVPFRPVSMYSVVIESNPASLMLYRSLLVQLLDQAERMIPGLTPVSLLDPKPKMKAYKL